MKLPCGCCEGVEAVTPLAVSNRPGLSALRYCAGTHATFFASMQARLSSHDFPELAPLATRELTDPAIALLDAWATVGEVLTFYQERVANEGYLRTATERRSVLELARLVGYRLRPGVAASVHLAYTIEKDAVPALIPKGARANSVPAGPGEQMQTFETSEPIAARYEWNQLKPRMTQPLTAARIRSANQLYLAGIATGLKPNDVLLVQVGGAAWPEPFRTVAVLADEAAGRTQVTLAPIATAPLPLTQSEAFALIAEVAQRFISNGPKPASDPAQTEQAMNLLKSLEASSLGKKAPEKVVKDGVAALDKLIEAARAGKFAPLVSWLQKIRAALDAVPDRIDGGAVKPPSAKISDASSAAVEAPGPDPVMAAVAPSRSQRFDSFLKVLETPPSIAPASSRRLERDSGAVFAVGADIYPKLLTTLVPRLGPLLYTGLRTRDLADPAITVIALRKAVPMFGHNAPRKQVRLTGGVPEYDEWPLDHADGKAVELDAAYDKLAAGDFALVERKGRLPVLARIATALPVSVAKYGITGRVTQLALDQDWLRPPREDSTLGLVRSATVHVLGEVLALAEEPVTEPVGGKALELDALYEGLESGRWLVISGERVLDGSNARVTGTELLMLADVKDVTSSDGKPRTVITLALAGGDQQIAYSYRRETVTIHGNVVHATHGETRDEVLGGGDAAKSLQSFVLKQPPLTYVSAPTVSGVASTLEVRVNEVLWHEADNLARLGPNDRGYSTRTGDDGKTEVVFGNGVNGARLPTGPENLKARYRNGIGRGGNVQPGQISLMATRPLGVKAVVNPIAASGGADRESRDQARKNAPLAVMALDRLVSTQDYADFARVFAGIAKASAVRLPYHGRQVVCVTVAGVDDIAIEKNSDLYRNLGAALRRYGDPFLAVRLEPRELLALVIGARVKVLPDYDWELVEPKIRAMLQDTFGFERRELGQGVAMSEVIAAIQGVTGVDWVDLFDLRALDRNAAASRFVGDDDKPQANVPARAASIVNGEITQAQLVFLQPGVRETLILNEATS